ncbi:MAG TPA: hypothetical protein VEN79_08655, partial [Terriglobia bacterium]|nr:hypothetical protein [Terriglobia bacterium]
AAFIQWFAGRYEEMQTGFGRKVLELRRAALSDVAHARTPEIIANLQAAFESFLEFSVECGVLGVVERDRFAAESWEALGHSAAAQAKYQQASEATAMFLRTLRAVLFSGRAHLKARDGKTPEGADRFGWGTKRGELVPFGDCIGWVDGENIYIDPTAAYRQVQLVGRDTGESITVTEQTLKRRLRDKGLLVSTDKRHETITVRRVVGGSSEDVLHFHCTTIFPVGDSEDFESAEAR